VTVLSGFKDYTAGTKTLFVTSVFETYTRNEHNYSGGFFKKHENFKSKQKVSGSVIVSLLVRALGKAYLPLQPKKRG